MNEALKDLMRERKMTRATVERLLAVSEFTVRSWLCNPKRKYFRRMPEAQYERLVAACPK